MSMVKTSVLDCDWHKQHEQRRRQKTTTATVATRATTTQTDTERNKQKNKQADTQWNKTCSIVTPLWPVSKRTVCLWINICWKTNQFVLKWTTVEFCISDTDCLLHKIVIKDVASCSCYQLTVICISVLCNTMPTHTHTRTHSLSLSHSQHHMTVKARC